MLPYSSLSMATGLCEVSSGSWTPMSPRMLVSMRTVSPVLPVTAARAPLSDLTLREMVPVPFSTIQLGLSVSPA